MLKHRFITSITIESRNGEKTKIALVETETDYVIARNYQTDGSWGSGEYYPKNCYSPVNALQALVLTADKESTSLFVKKISF